MDSIIRVGDSTAAATAYKLDTAAAGLVCMEEMPVWEYELNGTDDDVLDVWGLPISECEQTPRALLAATSFCEYYGTQ